MSRLFVFLFISTCMVLVSCDPDASKANAPGCYFHKEIKSLRWIDLTKKFADTLHLRSGDKERIFALSYSKEDKSNTISEMPTGISIKGTVTKYKNVYFLNEKRDSVFQIYAFTSKKRNSIIGLTSLSSQQSSLYSMVSSGHDDGLVLEKKGANYFLDTDKKKLLKIYSSILLEADTWALE